MHRNTNACSYFNGKDSVLKMTDQTHCTPSPKGGNITNPTDLQKQTSCVWHPSDTKCYWHFSQTNFFSYLWRLGTALDFCSHWTAFSSVPIGSCVSCSVSDWLWPPFTADAAVRGKHTLSSSLSSSLSCSPRLPLAAVWRQWHHPFFPLAPCLHSLTISLLSLSCFPLCIPSVANENCLWFHEWLAGSVWRRGGESQSCRGVMTG